MRPIVLGYSAPLSLSGDAAAAARDAFCARAQALGLSVSFVSERHAVTTTGATPVAPRTVHGRWRVVSFDGLLHKRTSLLMYGVKPDVMSDGEAMEHLLNEHGVSSLAWPIGDWSVVAVAPDGVLLACDYFGNRQLFYHVDGEGGVTWSDQNWALAEYAEREDAFDTTYVAGLLYFLPPAGRTPFRDVRAIPAGHVGVLDADGFAVRRYWSPTRRTIQLTDSREYAQAFFELMRDGVRERLAVPGRKWIEISGGVDSALVASCASSCVRENPGLGPIEAVHYTTERGESAGDTRRAREAATQLRLQLHTFELEQLLRRSTTVNIEDPREPIGAFRESTRIACEYGVNVLISGRLGDLVTGNREPEPALLPDLVMREGLHDALRALYEWAVFSETPVWYLLGRSIRDRLFSTRERRLVDNFTQRTRNKSSQEEFGRTPGASLAPGLEQAIAEWRALLDWPGRSELGFVDLWWWFAIETLRFSGSYRSAWGLTACNRTYPLSHRPLIEFMVACPWTAFLGPSQPRRLVHEHLGELLPPSLVRHILKSDTATWRIRPLQEMWSSLLSDTQSVTPNVVRAGLFSAYDIEALSTSLRTGRGATTALFPRVMQLELWLRSRPRRLGATHLNTEGGESYALRKA